MLSYRWRVFRLKSVQENCVYKEPCVLKEKQEKPLVSRLCE